MPTRSRGEKISHHEVTWQPIQGIWKNVSISQEGLLQWSAENGTSRLIVTPSIECFVMSQLHIPHLGIQKTTQMAKNLFWFPQMGKKLQDYIKECPQCQMWRHLPPRQPLIQTFGQEGRVKLTPADPWVPQCETVPSGYLST